MSRIAEYKQIDTKVITETIMVADLNEDGELTGTEHEETVTKEVPVMGLVYRDSTPEEDAEAERMQREMEEAEANREPTFEEKIEAQVMYTALMTDTLIEEE